MTQQRIRGQSATETLIVMVLVGLVFAATTQGPIADLLEAMASRYQRFSWAISLP